MTLAESIDDDEPDDSRYDALPSSKSLHALKPAMAAAAQKVYDSWVQDEDDELNGGGICHLIAEEIAGIMSDAGIPVSTVTASDVQHVYCVGQFSNGVFEVDIPYHLYERGSMFTWTKLEGVTFSTDDISVYRLDANPARMYIYVEEWDEE